jgi:hypothetical protein
MPRLYVAMIRRFVVSKHTSAAYLSGRRTLKTTLFPPPSTSSYYPLLLHPLQLQDFVMSPPSTPRPALGRIVRFSDAPIDTPPQRTDERSASPASSPSFGAGSMWGSELLVGPLNLGPVTSASAPDPVLSPGPPTSLDGRPPSQITTEDEEPFSAYLAPSLGASPSIASTEFFSAQGSAVDSAPSPPRTPSESLSDVALSQPQVLQTKGKAVIPGARGNTVAQLFVYSELKAARPLIVKKCMYFSPCPSRKIFS